MLLDTLKIVEEEFAKDREYDAPCCEGTLDDLLERIKERITLLGVEVPDPPGCDPRFGCADGKCYRHGNN